MNSFMWHLQRIMGKILNIWRRVEFAPTLAVKSSYFFVIDATCLVHLFSFNLGCDVVNRRSRESLKILIAA